MQPSDRRPNAPHGWPHWLGGIVLAAGFGSAACAADLQVSPISLQFTGSEQAQGVWLSNSGTQPLRAQIRVQRWFQAQDSDQLEPAHDLVASPPALQIAPGERQLVRIVRPQSTAAQQEKSYRVIVDELPSALRQEGGPSQALRFLLRYSIPVFVSPEERPSAPARLADARHLKLQWTGGASRQLLASNAGPRRFRISQMVHEDEKGHRTELVAGLLGYVLAGQSVSWVLPAIVNGLPPGLLKAKLNDDAQEQTLPVVGWPS